ncbi:tRNA (guanosine(46)-N7)-methyltransferase TrmB [Alkaliphilus pronyensis]|uniref:tRNA (guanine-N(7)-)-methyltransferase n=1 Tax=Alkaliphilus pronyensis TaxID=1482732 RepID=A0A6I0FFJ8_9FIRM|nr:tRNA (guanosine(46)-N7)-methyltransferase TrmB [Alkaliphilus pronyensis]KAB3537709.1 tRNA (guanosine(46)-N7)-methyltransferase TrmB [Alkaliphilus pronyensis]
MRVRNIPGVEGLLLEYSFFVSNPCSYINKWNDYFNNDNKIHIELGIGKGKFITTLARQNKDINYIGIEKSKELLYKVAKEVEGKGFNNLCLTNFNGEIINEVFGEEEIERIYLNFSDPWPKKRHEKRRLTHGDFLKKYHAILKKGGEIHFKTDSLELFEFSLIQLKNSNYIIKSVSYDLYKDTVNNVSTEYEEKFVKQGKRINKYVAIKP